MKAPTVIRVEGQDVPLRLSLGALSEIEEALGADTLAELAVQLANPSAGQLLRVLRILARAADPDIDQDLLSNACCDLREALGAMSKLFGELMGSGLPGKPKGGANDGAAG